VATNTFPASWAHSADALPLDDEPDIDLEGPTEAADPDRDDAPLALDAPSDDRLTELAELADDRLEEDRWLPEEEETDGAPLDEEPAEADGPVLDADGLPEVLPVSAMTVTRTSRSA